MRANDATLWTRNAADLVGLEDELAIHDQSG